MGVVPPEFPDDKGASSRPSAPLDRNVPAPPSGSPVNGHRPAPARRPDPLDDPPTGVHAAVPEGTAPAVPTSASEPPPRRGKHAGGSSDEDKAGRGGKTRGRRRKRTSFWKELPLLIVVALLLTFLIQTFLAKVYVIPSGSMETTLHGCTGCNNDRVLVDKISYRFSEPSPGDVVVFRGPDSWNSEVRVEQPTDPLARGLQLLGSLVGLAPPDEKDFVKRVIAVGGQTVQCCDSSDRVLVDGQPLDEPYVYYLPEAGPARQSPFGPITVPEGELWMMGDSRNNSADSRVPGHGPVPIENVIGQARVIVLPVGRFGGIDAIDPQPTAAGLRETGGSAGPPAGLGLLAALPLAAVRGVRRRGPGLEEAPLPDHVPFRAPIRPRP